MTVKMTAAPEPQRLLHSIEEVSRATGLSVTRLRRSMKEGELRARKFGRRTLISAADLDAFVNGAKSVA